MTLFSRGNSWRQERPSCAAALYPKYLCCLISIGLQTESVQLIGNYEIFLAEWEPNISLPFLLVAWRAFWNTEMQFHMKALLKYSSLLKSWSNSHLVQNQMSLPLRPFPLHSAIESGFNRICQSMSLKGARMVKLEFLLSKTKGAFRDVAHGKCTLSNSHALFIAF